jgi:hypothetical protein
MRYVVATLVVVVLVGCGGLTSPRPSRTVLASYKAGVGRDVVVLSGAARLDDYYNYDFGNAKPTHYSFALRDDRYEKVYLYARRDSDVGLAKALGDGAEHEVTVEAHPGARSRDVAEIVRLITVR